MKIIDYIKQLFSQNKKTANIITQKLVKKYGTPDQLEIALYDHHTPLANRDVTFNINTKMYTRTTDEEGIARLNINLVPGEYLCLVSFEDNEYNFTSSYAEVVVTCDTRMEGTDIIKNVSDTAVYQCAVYNKENNLRLTGATVDITVNGVTYTRITNTDGLAKLNINLGVGEYDLKAEFRGNSLYNSSSVDNSVVVHEDPEPEPEPQELWDYITETGGGKMGQRTGYTCGPHSLMQCIYRLTGIELSEMELKRYIDKVNDKLPKYKNIYKFKITDKKIK